MNLSVTCIQMDIAFGDPEDNFRRAEEKIRTAAKDRPDIIVLPELWTTGYDLTRLSAIADRDARQTEARIGALAREFGVHIVAGSVAKDTGEGVTNTMLVFNRHGEKIGEYSKLHLFRLMNEERHLAPGSAKGLFTVEGIPSAGVICYDIRFPEWIRAHTVQGAELLFVVAEWPLPRLTHWRSLLISRAIENQCYVVACNRSGSDPANVFAGHSMIIDPLGNVVAEAGEEETVLTGVLDTGMPARVRRQIPVFEDRRPEFYQ